MFTLKIKFHLKKNLKIGYLNFTVIHLVPRMICIELIVENHVSDQLNIYFTPEIGVSSVEHLNSVPKLIT